MPSALIVYSKHLEEYAKALSKQYEDVAFLKVFGHPTEAVLKIENTKDVVIGVGGGSVIDTAKIIAKDQQCIAIPTTASGAAMTPYATVWGQEKRSVVTQLPILKMDYTIAKKFSPQVIQSTVYDALAHAIESFWSRVSTEESRQYSQKSIERIMEYFKNKKDVNTLIEAGNLAGQAIAICKTNVVHATSYPITIEYDINHGTACGVVLPGFVDYMNYKGLPQAFGFQTTADLVVFLKEDFVVPNMHNFNPELIADKTMTQDKIQHGPKRIEREDLLKILRDIGIH